MKYKILLITSLFFAAQNIFTADDQEAKAFHVSIDSLTGSPTMYVIKNRTDTIASIIEEIFTEANGHKGFQYATAHLVDNSPGNYEAIRSPGNYGAIRDIVIEQTLEECGLWDSCKGYLILRLKPHYEEKDLKIRTLNGQEYTIKIKTEESIDFIRYRIARKLDREEGKTRLSFRGRPLSHERIKEIPGLWDDPLIHVVFDA